MLNQRGSSSAVALVVILPLLMVVCLGLSWLGHMAAVKSVCEEAARAGARQLAVCPDGDLAIEILAAPREVMMSSSDINTSASFTVDVADGVRSTGGLPLRTDGYAYCRVVYYYPVPIPSFWKKMSQAATPIWGGAGTSAQTTVPIVGEAFFVSEREGVD